MKTKIKLVLPIIALLLNVVPFSMFLMTPHSLLLFLLGGFPLVGFIIAVVHICIGEKRIGRPAMIVSIIAAAWLLVFVWAVILMTSAGVVLTGI